MKRWKSSSHMRLLHQDHVELLSNTYPRYRASHRKMLEGLLIPQLKHLFEHRILLCHATMALMIACSDTEIYKIISLWIHSLPPRKEGSLPMGTLVANSSLRTKDSYTSCQ